MSTKSCGTPEGTVYSPLSTTIPPPASVDEEKREKHENNDSEEFDNRTDDDEIVVPPDGGWGWVVVLGSFMCNLVVDGIIFSFGLFINDIASEFEVTSSYASLVGSLLSGFYLLVGPFTSAVANRYGFRFVAIVGSVIAALAFSVSYFANSVLFLCLIYGIIGGIGLGFIYVPAVVTVGFYFEKWRALATGIGVCGSGIGTFVFAPFCDALLRNLGWRYSLIVLGLVILSCSLFGLVFRPVKPTKIKDLKNKTFNEKPLVMDSTKLPAMSRIKMEEALSNLKKNSECSNEHQSTIPRMLGVNNNSEYPTAAELWREDNNEGYHTICASSPHKSSEDFNPEKRLSIPIIITDADKRKNEITDINVTTKLLLDECNLLPVALQERRHTMGEKRNRTLSENVNTHRSRKRTLTGSEINRPMYRDDIFFGASLTRLPQYTSQSSLAYNLSVMRPPTKHDVDEEKKHECKICPESVRRPLANMLDLSLLMSPSFLVLAMSGALTMLGLFVPFTYLSQKAVSYNIDPYDAVWLISTIGIANTIGRVISGLLSSHPSVNVLLVYNVALSISGISTILSGLSTSIEYQFLYATIYGLSISCFSSIRTVIVVDLLGLEKLTNAFGLLLLFQGIATIAGSPIAAQFYNATGSYEASFYLAGSFLLASAILCYPLNAINRWEKRQKKNEALKSAIV